MSELANSLIGLAILMVISLESLILIKRKTIPVIFFDIAVITTILYFIFGIFTIIYGVLLFGFLMFIKYRNHQYEEPDLNYYSRILSFSAVKNRLEKPKDMVVGTIQPISHNELKYNQKKMQLSNMILSGATLITGSTGSGKSTTLKIMLKQRIKEGRPVVFFDYKGEEDILDEIQGFAENAGLPYYEYSSRGCNFSYDPFTNLNETGKVEALMNTRKWSFDGSDEHYKTSMQLVIQNLIKDYETYRIENNETTNYVVGLYRFSKTYHPQTNERDGFNNLQKSLEILLSSRAMAMFADDPSFSFENDEPFVICFSFTSANKSLANYISSFVFTDIMDRGTRRHYQNNLLLCIDEFGTLEASILIKDLLEKGRSGGVQTIFSILDINQIAMTSGEFFVNAILGTINNYIIHAGATQQTADLLAGVQKYDKGYDIMSLRKPQKGRKPTALFISKYSIINKRNNQEVYKIVPYASVLKDRKKVEESIDETEDIVEINPGDSGEYIIPIEELDLTQPIDNIEQYL